MTAEPESGSPAAIDAEDVLDAAADAFVNDGLDALTFRRIAGRLGVADRAITELFRSVEDVLAAMLEREYLGMFHAIVEQMERDPLGGRLSRIYRYVLSAVHERPLARSMYLMERSDLSRILRLTRGYAFDPQLSIGPDLIDRMKAAGTVRRDVSSTALAAVVSATSAGAALLAPKPRLGDVVDGMVHLLERCADTDDTDTSRGKAALIAYADELAARQDEQAP
ncbi:MAG: TetR/AcrR family transcriptional regulator [Microbacteriaceae bacterium]|nr:TetR/AcrR family transcriptional regulator [Microbacteriaceae bacterium]